MLSYIDILKQAVRVADRNFGVLLTQILYGVILTALFVLIAGIGILVGVGSLASLSRESFTPENLEAVVQTSLSLIIIGIVAGIIFALVWVFMKSFVHAGNAGCVIDTVKGRIPGFKISAFFKKGRRFMVSMLGLYFIWTALALFVFLVMIVVAALGYGLILLPLQNAGRDATAFAISVPLIFIMIVGLLLFLFFLYAGWYFSSIALISEEHNALSSINGAYHFVRKNFWDSVLFALFMFVLGQIALSLGFIVMGLLQVWLSDNERLLVLLGTPLFIINLMIQMYVPLVTMSGFSVYYINRTIPPTPVAEPPVSGGDVPVDDVCPVEEVHEGALVEEAYADGQDMPPEGEPPVADSGSGAAHGFEWSLDDKTHAPHYAGEQSEKASDGNKGPKTV